MQPKPFSLRHLLTWSLVGLLAFLLIPTLIGVVLHVTGHDGPAIAAAQAVDEVESAAGIEGDVTDASGGESAAEALDDEAVEDAPAVESVDAPADASGGESGPGVFDDEAAGAGEIVSPVSTDAATAAEEPADSEDAQGPPDEAPIVEDDPAEDEEEALDEDDEEPTMLTRELAQDVSIGQRLLSLLGIFGFLGLAWLLSNNRRRINWRIVIVGVSIQITFAIFILKTPIGQPIFEAASAGFVRLLDFTQDGNAFLFGSYVLNNEIHPSLINFVFAVLPTIIFFSSLMTVLYYLGIMQRVVAVVARAMQLTMGTSGSETTSAAANIFVGQTEAPLMVKPFVATMTMSELMAIMTAGFATVAGGVLALYVQFLSPFFPGIAGHLMAASVMAAPGALVIAKIMFPETEESDTKGSIEIKLDNTDANVIDAAARGAGEGLMLALNVAAMLLAFVALISLIDFMVGVPSFFVHGRTLAALLENVAAAGIALPAELAARCDMLGDVSVPWDGRAQCIMDVSAAAGVETPNILRRITLADIFGVLFFPIAVIMGAPLADAFHLGQLLGTKMVVNELVAYLNLATMIQDPEISLSPRTIILATYALCGFANFSSIAIQIGGIGTIAPERRSDLARLGLRAMIAGSIASFLNATIAGLVI